MMENEKFEESLGVNERIRRLKHWLVFITFGVPMLFTLLNILIWVIFEVDTNCKRNLNHFLLSFPALKMDWHLYESDFHSIDLVFNCAHRRYVKKTNYKKHLFSQTTIQHWFEHFFDRVNVGIRRGIWRRC